MIDESVVTLGGLQPRIDAARAGLTAAGMRPGDRVFFAVRPGPEALVLGLAVLDAGAAIVVADPGAGDELFAARAALLRSGGGREWAAAESLLYALTARRGLRALIRRRGLLLPDFSRLSGARHIRTGRWLPGVPKGALTLARLERSASAGRAASAGLSADSDGLSADGPAATAVPSAGPAVPSVDPDAPALVVFTSGTTAAPRAVVHTRATLAAARALFNARIGWGPGDVVHTDQLMIALPALAAGAAWTPTGEGATHLFGTPAHIAKLLDTGTLPPTLRCVLLGAAPVPPPILRRLRQAAPDAEILSVYGTTEALPIAVATAEDKLAHVAEGDLLGTPLPGISIRISEDDEILVRGPHLAGYLDRPLDELATGDLGRLNADGRLVLLGRAKDMLIRGSFNLYPGLYEPAIAAQPGVADCAYVGVPDPDTADEQVVLAVVPAVDTAPEAVVSRLAAALPQLIDTAACPDRIVPVAAIPKRGRTSKPDRDALRELVA